MTQIISGWVSEQATIFAHNIETGELVASGINAVGSFSSYVRNADGLYVVAIRSYDEMPLIYTTDAVGPQDDSDSVLASMRNWYTAQQAHYVDYIEYSSDYDIPSLNNYLSGDKQAAAVYESETRIYDVGEFNWQEGHLICRTIDDGPRFVTPQEFTTAITLWM